MLSSSSPTKTVLPVAADQEIKTVQLDDIGDDEMDLSEDDGTAPKKSRWDVRKVSKFSVWF